MEAPAIKRWLDCAFISALVLAGQYSFAQISPGPLASVEQQKDGVVFQMQRGAIKVLICNPSLIHVLYSPTGSFPNSPDPMVVRTTWPDATWKLDSADKSVSLSTSALRVEVARKDGSVTFFDAQGKQLLRDGGEDGGKLMAPAKVNGEQTYNATEMFHPMRGEAFYGLGQHQSGVWDYAGESVELSQDNTNISIPFFVSTNGYGVFWNNPSVSRFNDRFPLHLFVDAQVADVIDYYFIYGPELDPIIAQYRDLTGQAPLFGKWAYGFWQCKNRYKTQEEILGVAQKYRSLGIPIDNIVQDWFWWTQKGSHIFNPKYPDPKLMVDTLHQEHFHVMISVWPSFQPGSQNYDTFARDGFFIRENSDAGGAQPALRIYDPFNPQAREFYWQRMDDQIFKLGFDAWWLDTTEPETDREENVLLHAQTGMGSGARYANLFPLMTTMAVYDGQRAATSDKRVFILTRSAAPGMQRNAAAAWSGDIFGNWHTFKRQIPAGLNYSLSGLPYWTTDIGGFYTPGTTDPAYQELFVRWFEYGSFCPIFRVHGTRSNDQNELWSYGEQAQSILTKYDALRYRLMPYIYSLAWRVTREGYTVMRPLVMDFRGDERARDIGDQFMFGPAIEVNPVTDPGAKTRRLYLPPAAWSDFWTGRSISGGDFITADAPLETLPLYVRAGSIIPMGPRVQYTSQKAADPIEIRVYPGADGDFTLYEDDGETYNYEKGAYSTIPMHWSEANKTLTLGERQGSFSGMLQSRVFNVIWVSEGHGNGLGPTEAIDKAVQYDGHAVTVTR
jgi:alpha-D-xyloside xylohydrolase